jgi:hypothetical protein
MKSLIYTDKPRPSLRWALRLVLAGAAAVAVAVAFQYNKGHQETQASAPASGTPARVSVLPDEHSRQAKPPESGGGAAALPARETRTAQIDRLARGTPAEALEATRLLIACENVGLAQRIASESPEPEVRAAYAGKIHVADCDGVTPGQRTMLIPLALKAARATVPGGFAALRTIDTLTFQAGLGEDPTVAQARPAILAAYVKAGDPTALVTASMLEDPKTCIDPPACSNVNPYLSLVHWTAFVEAGALHGSTDAATPRLAAALTPEQTQAAIAEGRALYANRTQR